MKFKDTRISILLIIKTILCGSEALVCRNCLSQRGLKGCLPIITEGLVQDPVLCLTVTSEDTTTSVGSHRGSATILRVGAGHSAILGFNLTAYGGERHLNGKCVFMSKKFVRDAMMPAPDLGKTDGLRVKVCGCKTDFCNDERGQFWMTDEVGASTATCEQSPKAGELKKEDRRQNLIESTFPFLTPSSLKCHSCSSLTGLEGCLPVLIDIGGKPVLTCVTMTIRYEAKFFGISMALESIARFGLPSTYFDAQQKQNGGEKCWPTLPPGMTIQSVPNSYKLFSVQTCLCKKDGCNCPIMETKNKKEIADNELIQNTSISCSPAPKMFFQPSYILWSIIMTMSFNFL